MVLNRNCPICDKRNGEKIEHICMNVPENYRLPDSYNIVVCDNCGMVYADTSASVEDYDCHRLLQQIHPKKVCRGYVQQA